MTQFMIQDLSPIKHLDKRSYHFVSHTHFKYDKSLIFVCFIMFFSGQWWCHLGCYLVKEKSLIMARKLACPVRFPIGTVLQPSMVQHYRQLARLWSRRRRGRTGVCIHREGHLLLLSLAKRQSYSAPMHPSRQLTKKLWALALTTTTKIRSC